MSKIWSWIVFLPSQFFDLSEFNHACIFDLDLPIWEVLKKIADYLHSQCQSFVGIQGKIEKGAFLLNPEKISIGRGCVVESGSYIKGPCVIGKDCQLRQGAYIRENVIVGDRCVIGHATEVKNSIFFNDTKAGHFAYIGDSILGNRVNLGAGTKCANIRFDKKDIWILKGKERFSTNLRKLGVIMGDDAQTGCNSVTNPGTVMGKGSVLGPCVTARGVILKKGVVKESGNARLYE